MYAESSKTDSSSALLATPLPYSPQQRRRRGLCYFLFHNYLSVIAFIAGLILTLAVFFYTWWLSKQTYNCPEWAIDCAVKRPVLIFKANSNIIQGILTTTYVVGLAALLCTTCMLGEIAVWPILHQQKCTLEQLDTYLKATRGSLISQPLALIAARSLDAVVVILCVFIPAALSPLGATVVGYAFGIHDITIPNIASNVIVANGIGLKFTQPYPGPPTLPGSVMQAWNLMSAWSNNLTMEPLPEHRGYIVDRTALALVGNMSASVVRVQKSINCTPRALQLSKGGKVSIKAATSFPTSDSYVHLRIQPFLTAWVDDVEEVHANRSVSTVVFAIMNGTIEGGKITDLLDIDNKLLADEHFTKGISAIACAIDVELLDDIITIGTSTTERASLGTVAELYHDGPVATLATWLGVATTVFGINVYGAQPMYIRRANGVGFWTSVMYKHSEHWNLSEIEEFIDVSAGAIAMRMRGFIGNSHPQTVSSQYWEKQLDHRRSYVLLFPIATIFITTLILAWRIVAMHNRLHVPAMRLATVGDILKSSQTAELREAAWSDALDPTRESKLGKMEVQYGVCPGEIVGLGSPDTVSRFEK